jgi:thioredoxin 1
MEKTLIEVFTSPTCPHCPSAKKVVEEVFSERGDVIMREMNSVNLEVQSKMQEFQISSVPTIFIKGPGHGEILAMQGTPSKERLMELIDLSQGKKNLEEVSKKKGFFESLFGKKIKLE